MRKIARETGIKRESVRMIAKNELGLRPYKLQKAQLFTDKMKETRLQRCRSLLRRVAGQQWEKILFTDEKLFAIEKLFASREAVRERTIIKMTEFGQKILPVHLQSSDTRNTLNL